MDAMTRSLLRVLDRNERFLKDRARLRLWAANKRAVETAKREAAYQKLHDGHVPGCCAPDA